MFGKPPKNKKLVASHKNKDIEHLLIESERTKNNLASLVCSVNDLTRDLVEQLRTELNEKDTELTATAEISTDAIFLCNANGLVVRTNKRADQMLEAAGHKTKVIWDYIDVPRRDWQLFEQDPSVITFKTKTGRTIESTIDVTALDRMDGTRSYIVMVSISSHPWDDIHLSQSKGSLLVTNGIISASSNAAENSLKYGHEEMLGKRFIDLIDKEDRAFISKYIISMRREAILDCCIIAKDGSKLYCRIATSFFGPEDKFILTINNIGVDQAARQSNFVRFMGKDYEFNSIKYDSTEPEYFVFLTPELDVKYMSANMKELYEFKDPEGKNLAELMTEEEFEIAKMHFRSLTERDSERLISIRLMNKNSKTWLEWLDQAFFDDDGNVLEYRRSGRT